MNGTIAQPAYDAPAHSRRFDALLLTDNWQNIINLGYLKHKHESKRKRDVVAFTRNEGISNSYIRTVFDVTAKSRETK